MKIPCIIHDRCEGTIRVVVEAEDDDAAYEEAEIYAAELGCRHVEEIEVSALTDDQYSSGRSRAVALRSASVMIHTLSSPTG